MTISVIVPVHNACNTLQRCVDSILNQTHHDIELILVENGSSDLSLQLCHEYANKDSRIKVLSLQSSGISKARNAGLRCISGDYFTFVDSDDYLEPIMLEKLSNAALSSKSDMTFCRIKNFKSDGSVFVSEERNLNRVVLEKDIRYLFALGNDYVRNVIFRILYKSKKFSNLFFNEDMNCCEDCDYLFKAIALSNNNAVVSDPLYNYSYNYDNPDVAYKKYYQDKTVLNETFKYFVQSIRELCDKFHLDEFSKAVVYAKYIELIGIVLKTSDYRCKIRLFKKDEFWQDVNTRENYELYKKYYKGKKLKIKARLIYKNRYFLYRVLAKFYKLKKK